MPEDLLRKYRPSGPPPDLRARIVAEARPAWPWAAAAAALLAVVLGLHATAPSLLNEDVQDNPLGVASRIENVAQRLGGSDDARREATLIVMKEQLEASLPPVDGATGAGRPR